MLQWQETVLSVAVGLATLGRAIAPGQVMASDPQPAVAAQEGTLAEVVVAAEAESNETAVVGESAESDESSDVLYLVTEDSGDGDPVDVAAIAQVTPPAEGATETATVQVEGQLIQANVSDEPKPATTDATVTVTVNAADAAAVGASVVATDAAAAAEDAAAAAKAGADAEAALRKDMEAAIARGDVSEYWIGLEAIGVDDALRAQLELPENQGLLVVSVIEGAPAEQAGLKRYDVVTAVNDATVNELGAIGKVVKEKKDAELTLKVIRAAKPLSITIKPAKRPLDRIAVWTRNVNTDENLASSPLTGYRVALKNVAEAQQGQNEVLQNYVRILHDNAAVQAQAAEKHAAAAEKHTVAAEELAKLHRHNEAAAVARTQLLEQIAKGNAAGSLLENINVRVGTETVPPGEFKGQVFRVPAANAQAMVFASGKPELPEGTSVTISHSNNAPTKIIVVQANKDGTLKQSIETTSDKLDVLPEELRKSVEPLLSQVTTMTGKDVVNRRSGARNVTIRRLPPGMSGLRSPVAKWGFGQTAPGVAVVEGHALPPGMTTPGFGTGSVAVFHGQMSGETDKKIDDLTKQIEALTKAVKELEARLGEKAGK